MKLQQIEKRAQRLSVIMEKRFQNLEIQYIPEKYTLAHSKRTTRKERGNRGKKEKNIRFYEFHCSSPLLGVYAG